MTPANHDNSEPASEISAGSELAIKVGTDVMEWKRLSIYSWRSPEGHRYLPKFDTDISAALPILDKWDEVEMEKIGSNWLVNINDCGVHVGYAESLSTAICLAALAAVDRAEEKRR